MIFIFVALHYTDTNNYILCVHYHILSTKLDMPCDIRMQENDAHLDLGTAAIVCITEIAYEHLLFIDNDTEKKKIQNFAHGRSITTIFSSTDTEVT